MAGYTLTDNIVIFCRYSPIYYLPIKKKNRGRKNIECHTVKSLNFSEKSKKSVTFLKLSDFFWDFRDSFLIPWLFPFS